MPPLPLPPLLLLLLLLTFLSATRLVEGRFGVAIDIDGVLKQWKKACVEGRILVSGLQKFNVPFILFTNGGGGRTEAGYAREMTKMLRGDVFDCAPRSEGRKKFSASDYPIEEIMAHQMVLSYSPFGELEHLKMKNVLIVGTPSVKDAAKAMGFKNAISITEYARRHPRMDPYATVHMSKAGTGCNSLLCENLEICNALEFTAQEEEEKEEEETWDPIDAIFVMSEPGHFAQALQICTDVLLSPQPGLAEISEVQTPIFFSNPDFLWRGEFPNNRFGTGAFIMALRLVYKERLLSLGFEPNEADSRIDSAWHVYGKPNLLQYEYAKRRLQNISASPLHSVWMVGDNHETDILGASRASWNSVLVKTGVWRGKAQHSATAVQDSAADALTYILRAEAHQKVDL